MPKLPAPPGKTLSVEQLHAYWTAIPPEQQKRVMGYLYREWPFIVRQQSDPNNPNYIDKFSEPVTVEEILNIKGAGMYSLRLTDNDRKKFGEVCSCRIDLKKFFPDYPPVLDYRELDLDAAENRSYIQWARAKGLLKVDQPVNPADTATAALADITRSLLRDAAQRKPENAVEAAAFPKLLEMFKEANTTSLNMVVSQMKQTDPEQFLKLVTAIKELSGSSSENLLQLLLKTQAEHSRALADAQNRQIELLTKMFDTRAGGSGIGQIKEMAETVATLKDTFGGAESGASSNRWDFFQSAVNALPQALAYAANIIGNVVALRKGGDMVPAPPVRQPSNPAEIPAPATTGEETRLDMPAYGRYLAMLEAPILNALNNNWNGQEFAAWLIDGFGQAAYSAVANLGFEGIMGALQTVPNMWAKLAPIQPQVEQFIQEFLLGPPAEAEEQPPEEPPARPRKKP